VGELKYHQAKFLHLKVMGENQIEIILGGETLCKPWYHIACYMLCYTQSYTIVQYVTLNVTLSVILYVILHITLTIIMRHTECDTLCTT